MLSPDIRPPYTEEEPTPWYCSTTGLPVGEIVDENGLPLSVQPDAHGIQHALNMTFKAI